MFHDRATRVRRSAVAFAAGVALGLANLAGNWLIASADPELHSLLAQRMMTMDAILAVVAAPLQEEIIFRWILMNAIAWLVSRVAKDPSTAFTTALLASSILFGLAHLDRPMPVDPALANGYRVALLAKYTLAGLPLGWLFWRWGLAYAILCHAASNATHLVVQSAVF